MTVKTFYNLAKKDLYPICRSITGKGIVKSLKIIKKKFPQLKIFRIKSGTRVFDWKVPSEWNIKDAYIIDKYKRKIVDFKKNNLHVVNYSVPVSKKISKEKLLKKLHYLKNQKKAIPYVTSYYNKDWGFCINYLQKKKYRKKI